MSAGDPIEKVIDQMVKDGRPPEEIRSFVSWASNKLRASKLEDVNAEYGLWGSTKRGISEFGGNLKDRLVGAAKGAGKLATMITDIPQAYKDLRDVPEARRELGRGVSDAAFGVPAWLADKTGATDYAGTEAHDTAVSEDPRVANMRSAGMVGTSMVPAGPMAQLGRGSLATMRALPIRPGLAAMASVPLASTAYATAHAAVSPNERLAPSLAEDGTIDLGAPLTAATDPGNAVVPLALSALPRRNPTIRRYAEARASGALKEPAMKALPKGREGTQRATEIAQQRVAAREVALDQAASDAYQNAMGELRRPEKGPVTRVMPPRLDPTAQMVDEMVPSSPNAELFAAAQRVNAPGVSPQARYRPDMPIRGEAPPPEGLARPVDREALAQSLRGARSKRINPDTGQPYLSAEGTTSKLGQLAETYERPGQWVDDAQADYGRRFEPPVDTVGGVLGQRRALQRASAFRSPSPTPEQLASQDAYQALRGAIRKAAPDVGAADDAYSRSARQAERRRDILYRTEEDVLRRQGAHPDVPDMEYADEIGETPPQMRVGKEQAARTTLGRVEDVNEPGLRVAPYLREFAAMDPEFASALEFIANKKAQEGTRFSLRAALPTSLTGATEGGGFGPAIRQNARAVGAKILDPAGLRLNPIMQAYMLDQERKRKMAQSLRNGGRAP